MRKWRRRILLIVVLSLVAALLAAVAGSAYQGSSFYDNVAPKSQLEKGALLDRYPMFNYSLDSHVGDIITTPNVGHVPGSGGLVGPKDKPGLIDWIIGNTVNQAPTGVDPAAMLSGVLFLLTSLLWYLTLFWTFIAITVFSWAFSLDFLNGAGGALAPVAHSVQHLYADLGSWLPVSITIMGTWALWGIARGRHGSTFAQLGLTLVCFVIALWIITQPLATIGGGSKWANDASVGILASLNGDGATGDPKTSVANRLTRDLIQYPWLIANFGGLEHCVDGANKPVKPKSSDCKTLVDHRRYLDRWLSAGVANSDARNLEYEALRDGHAPAADALNNAHLPADAFAGYHVSQADKASVDAQQKEGALQRLGMVVFIAGGNLGSNLLLLALSIGMILSQILALLLFVFAPIALLIVVAWPGGGQAVFFGWLSKLVFVITRKIWYSLILAAILTITSAVSSASGELGWGLAYGLQAAFYWMVLIFRKEIYATMLRALPGGQHGAHRENRVGRKIIGAYYGARVARGITKSVIPSRHRSPASGTAPPDPDGTSTTHPAATAAKGVVDGYPASGHSDATVAAGTSAGTAIAELEGEHVSNVDRLRREESRRATVASLKQRDAAAAGDSGSSQHPPGLLDTDAPRPQPLNDRERRQLKHLESNQMDPAAYRGLRDTVREVEQRHKDSGGIAFTDDQVRERERVIRARESGNDTSASSTQAFLTQTERDTARIQRVKQDGARIQQTDQTDSDAVQRERRIAAATRRLRRDTDDRSNG